MDDTIREIGAELSTVEGVMMLNACEVVTLFTVLESSTRQCREWMRANPGHPYMAVMEEMYDRRSAIFRRVIETMDTLPPDDEAAA